MSHQATNESLAAENAQLQLQIERIRQETIEDCAKAVLTPIGYSTLTKQAFAEIIRSLTQGAGQPQHLPVQAGERLNEAYAEIMRLQNALAFWLPTVPPFDHPAHQRVANDAFLLIGLDGDLPDPKSAQELGWITLAATPCPPSSAQGNEEREAFEQHMRSLGLRKEGNFAQDAHGRYLYQWMHDQWKGWEARAALSAPAIPTWISVEERLPEDETPVLILRRGELDLGELVWERPGFEDTYEAFRFWDRPNDDGQGWEWDEVTHWMPLPAGPAAQIPANKEVNNG